MRKGIWFLGIVLFIIGLVYLSSKYMTPIGGSSETTDRQYDSVEVKLANGEMIELTGEEAALEAAEGEKKVVLTQLGMTCSSCKYAVSTGLENTEEIIAFYVNLADDRATVVFNPDEIDIETSEPLQLNRRF
jgi:copper chaperone CopZ